MLTILLYLYQDTKTLTPSCLGTNGSRVQGEEGHLCELVSSDHKSTHRELEPSDENGRRALLTGAVRH